MFTTWTRQCRNQLLALSPNPLMLSSRSSSSSPLPNCPSFVHIFVTTPGPLMLLVSHEVLVLLFARMAPRLQILLDTNIIIALADISNSTAFKF